MTGSRPTRSPIRSRPWRLRLLGASSATLVVAAGLAGQATAAGPGAPLLRADPAWAIPGSYVVGLKPQADTTAAVQRARRRGADVRHEFRSGARGYSADLDAASLAAVRQDPDVAYVEENQLVRPAGTQTDAPWDLDRIDQTALPLYGTFNTVGTGAGVTAYVIDSGIRETHGQLRGRVAAGADFTDLGTTTDCFGHGTLVAGEIGGTTYGVAKEVTLVPLRVFDCKGIGVDIPHLRDAITWVTEHGTAPGVVNMSLEVSDSLTIRTAVQASIAAGFTYVVSAGNGYGDATDACQISPANVPGVITVGASTSSDARWVVSKDGEQSNVGPCVDLYAPGAEIRSAYSASDTATATGSGTSFAAPLVAGVAALYLQANPKASPAQVKAAIVGLATKGVLTDLPADTANRLLYYPAGPNLYLGRSAATSGDALELNAATAASTWQGRTSQATRFAAKDAVNGRLQTIGADLWFTKYRNTASGLIEVKSATAASGYTAGQDAVVTRFALGDAANAVFQVGGNGDLWQLKVRGTKSGNVELYSATAASGYSAGYRSVATRFGAGDIDNGVFQTGSVTQTSTATIDTYADLWFIKTRNTSSGSVEVFCQVGSNGYAPLPGTYKPSWIPAAEAANGTFMVIGRDLWFVKVRNTASGKVELWTATYASVYRSESKLVTGWPAADADTGTWSVS